MLKTLAAIVLLMTAATTAPAVADRSDDVLQETIARLTGKVDDLEQKVEHKNDLLACERNRRRALEVLARHSAHDVHIHQLPVTARR